MPGVGEVDPHLVRPARLQGRLHQARSPQRLADLVVGHRPPAAVAAAGVALAVRGVAAMKGVEGSPRRCEPPRHHHDVAPLHRVHAELLCQALVGLVGLARHQHSAGQLVQPVDDPGPQHTADP